MAAGVLPAPGTEFGPCDATCQHADCKATREMAATACRMCGMAIGYKARFYDEPQGLVHAICAEYEAP